jgi:hypothetical protein
MTGTRKLWQTYEEVARSMLGDLRDRFGIDDIEGKQSLPGDSGTTWEIEGKATNTQLGGFLVIECRRYTTKRLNQEAIGAVAFRILDLGASGGIVVSPLDLQLGAKLVASTNNILHVQLAPWSTAEDYLAKFMGKSFHKASVTSGARFGDSVEASVVSAPPKTDGNDTPKDLS